MNTKTRSLKIAIHIRVQYRFNLQLLIKNKDQLRFEPGCLFVLFVCLFMKSLSLLTERYNPTLISTLRTLVKLKNFLFLSITMRVVHLNDFFCSL